MKIYCRALRDKYGARYYVLFKDGEGIDNPLAFLTETEFTELVEMHDKEQSEMDKQVTK